MLLYIPATLCSRAALTALRPWTMLPRPCHDLPCLAFLPWQFWHGPFGKDTFDILLKSCSVLGVCNLLPSFTCECHWMASGPLLCLAVLCLSIAIYSHQTTSNVHQSGRFASRQLSRSLRDSHPLYDGANLMRAKWGMDQIKHQHFPLISDDIGWYRVVSQIWTTCNAEKAAVIKVVQKPPLRWSASRQGIPDVDDINRRWCSSQLKGADKRHKGCFPNAESEISWNLKVSQTLSRLITK